MTCCIVLSGLPRFGFLFISEHNCVIPLRMEELQHNILNAALPHVVFDSWTMNTLEQAAESLGMDRLDAHRAFPAGIMEALECYSRLADQQMLETLEKDYSLDTMKIRERIATAVMVRLRQAEPHKEAVRRAVAHYNMPWNAPLGMKSLYRTVDAMWRAAGDESTDFNFYTKRILLAKVYMTTLYYWLNDGSNNMEDTEAFLHRRIDNVMQIQKAKFKAREWWEKFPFANAS